MPAMRTTAILLLTILAFALPAAATAQNTSREFARMKLDKDYLCEESTTQDPGQAMENADLLLINRVTEYLAANHPGVPLSPAVLAGIKHLTMPRGDHTRVLSYISIAEILGGAPPAPPAPAPSSAPAPASSAPAPASSAQPVGLSELQRAASPADPDPSALPAWQLELIQELLKAKDMAEASSLLGFFRQIRKIKTFGIVTECPDRAAVYWLVGDPAGGIKAALSPETPGGSRLNFSDGSRASLSSFSGSQAVWFSF